MKAIFVAALTWSLFFAGNSAFGACDRNECGDGNKCYSPGGISCNQSQQCKMTGDRASWSPLGEGFACNGSFKMTIIEASAKAQMYVKALDVRPQIAMACDSKEVCSFLPKGPGGLLGDLTPGSHYLLSIKYVCRSATQSKGVVRIERNENQDEEVVNFNCIE